MKTISFKLEEEKLQFLNTIAKAEQVALNSIINSLIDEKISLYQWQLEKIAKGLKQADNKEYSKDEEIINLLLG